MQVPAHSDSARALLDRPSSVEGATSRRGGQGAGMELSVPDGHDEVDIVDGEGAGEVDGIRTSQPCRRASSAFDGLGQLDRPRCARGKDGGAVTFILFRSVDLARG